MQSKFNIVLYSPDIPGNTGSIGRTCIALDIRLILIHPLGFELSQKAVRRAGLDYWKHVNVVEYQDWDDFIKNENPSNSDLFFFSKTSKQTYFDCDFKENCFLIFGAETKGLPEHIFQNYSERIFSLPMYSDKVRSLNLSNAATAVAYEAVRQLRF